MLFAFEIDLILEHDESLCKYNIFKTQKYIV